MSLTDAQIRALGFDLPTGTDLIRDGDDNISKNARAAANLVTDLENDFLTQLGSLLGNAGAARVRGQVPPEISSLDEMNHADFNGYWQANTQNNLIGTPFPITQSTLVEIAVGSPASAARQVVTDSGQSWWREASGGGSGVVTSWGPWRKYADLVADLPLALAPILIGSDANVDELAPGRSYAPISGTASTALGLPSTTGTGQRGVLRVNSLSDNPEDTNNLIQEWTVLSGTPGNFVRSKISGAWRDWERQDVGDRLTIETVFNESTAPILIGSDANVDELAPGRSYAPISGTASTALGLPSTTGTGQRGVLRVNSLSDNPEDTNNLIQEWTVLSGTPGNFVRSKISGAWRDWERQDVGGTPPPAEQGGLPGQVIMWGSSTPAGMVPELADELRPYGVQVYNHARGGQWTSQTVANIGCTPINLSVAGGTIPASGPVEINAADSILDGVDLYLAAPAPLMGWLGGIYGELEGYGDTFANRGIRFTRARAGSAITLEAPPAWVPEVKTPAHLHILGMGKNDLNVGRTSDHLARVIARKDDAVAYWQARHQSFLILGHFVNSGTPASDDGRTQIEADNADSAARYPDNFLDMQELLSGEELWEWTGITPTSEDLDEQALGNMPPSIQGAGNHLNTIGDRYISWKIAQWMVTQKMIGEGRAPFHHQLYSTTI